MNYTLIVLFCVLYCVAGGPSAFLTNDEKTDLHSSPASGCQKPCHDKPCAEHEEGTLVAIPAVVSVRRKDEIADWTPELVFEDSDGNMGCCISFETSFGNIFLKMFSPCGGKDPTNMAIVPRYLHNPGDWLHFNISKCANGFCILLCHSLTYNLLRISATMSKMTVHGTASFGYTPPGALKRKTETNHLSPTPQTDQVTTKSPEEMPAGDSFGCSAGHMTSVRIMLSVVTSLTALVFIFSITILTIILQNRTVLWDNIEQ